MANIEKYINSLADDIIIIDLKYKNINYIPDLIKFKNLVILDCYKIELTYLPNLPNSLKHCSFNPNINKLFGLYFIYNDYEIIKFNKKISIFNRFRELYFALKFKKQFYKLYETVAMKRYHPSNLIKLLENVGDDEEKIDLLLNNW
jgi:hypothetical protein